MVVAMMVIVTFVALSAVLIWAVGDHSSKDEDSAESTFSDMQNTTSEMVSISAEKSIYPWT